MFDAMKLKPETAAETEALKDPRDFRARLNRYSRDDALTRQIYDLAYVHGWSGEDMMTMLAYHALVQLEEYRERDLAMLRTSVMRPTLGEIAE